MARRSPFTTTTLLAVGLVWIISTISHDSGSFVVAAAERPARPEFDDKARVKQHRAGAQGELVPGEEDLRKIILQWDHIAGAQEYQVCHECSQSLLEEDTDATTNKNEEDGKIHNVSVGHECGGKPCFILPGAPLGYNAFHLRVKVGDEWSEWSSPRNFFVKEPGTVSHEEL